MSEKDSAGPAGDPNMLKTNEIARSVIGTGIKMTGFHVEFQNGTASLRGSVTSEEDRQRVLSTTRSIAGVQQVKDDLQVGGTAAAPAGKSLGGQSYTVKSGDTLSQIAKTHYGHASEFKKIFEANRDVLSDPDKIQPGQVLKLP